MNNKNQIIKQVEEENKKSFKRKTIISVITCSIIMGGVGFGIGYGVSSHNQSSNTSISSEMQAFLNYYNYFKNNYYIEQDERTLLDGLYYGLTSSVDDDYTFYVSSQNNESQGLTTTQVGIGFERAVYFGNALITHVMSNSPASKAKFIDSEGNVIEEEVGLQDGDIITKVREYDVVGDYYVLKENKSSDWSNHFSGLTGSNVEIVINRNGEEKRCVATRASFDTDKVRLISKNYSSTYKEATIKISSFLGSVSSGESTPARELIDLFKNDLLKDNDSIDNLVIDLRSNGGGYVINCSDLLSLFVGKQDSYGYYYSPRNETYTSIDSSNNLASRYQIYSYDGWKNYNDSIKHYTIILDENSASATESFALGMRDFDQTKEKTTIVGETSYGKGIAQSFIYPFASQGDYTSSIRYTYQNVVSIKKTSINKRGIVPDVMVDALYRSIQDEDEYNYYRKEITSIDDAKDKAIVLTRIEALLSTSYDGDITSAITAYQNKYSLTVDGTYNEETATSLNDNFYEYYHDNKPTNLYSAFIEGSDDIDSFSSSQRKFVKRQIEAITGNSYDDFYSACLDFQKIYKDELSSSHTSVYDLETSYLLQGKIYNVNKSYKDKVLEIAKESYGA